MARFISFGCIPSTPQLDSGRLLKLASNSPGTPLCESSENAARAHTVRLKWFAGRNCNYGQSKLDLLRLRPQFSEGYVYIRSSSAFASSRQVDAELASYSLPAHTIHSSRRHVSGCPKSILIFGAKIFSCCLCVLCGSAVKSFAEQAHRGDAEPAGFSRRCSRRVFQQPVSA